MSGEALGFGGVSFGYRDGFALVDVDFSVARGEVVFFCGPNGSGKTTVIRLLSRIIEPNGGEVRLLGERLRELSQREVACRMAVVPQETWSTFPFRVREMIAMGRIPKLGWFRLEGPGDRAAIERAMQESGTEHLAERRFDSLSGGEKQRVIVARALAQDAPILVLDEPTAHLDLGHAQQLFDLLARLNREQGITLLVVSHELEAASQYADRVVLLQQGRVCASGAPGEVLTADRIEQVFGCRVLIDAHPTSGGIRITPLPAVNRTEGCAEAVE